MMCGPLGLSCATTTNTRTNSNKQCKTGITTDGIPAIYFTETSNTLIRIQGPDPNTDFLVDNVTLYEVPENPNWRTEADINIENHRKSDIELK